MRLAQSAGAKLTMLNHLYPLINIPKGKNIVLSEQIKKSALYEWADFFICSVLSLNSNSLGTFPQTMNIAVGSS